MAGQGRNADGLTESGPGDAVNVVRFPGDWFGPLGDLVPIGTDAEGERDEQDPYGEEPSGPGADSFWGGDAEAAHRVGTPALLSRRRSRRLRLMLPIGAAAAVAVAVTVVLSSGTQVGGAGRVLHEHKAGPATAKLSAASQSKPSRLTTRSSGPARSTRERAKGAVVTRHPAEPRATVSAEARPHAELAVTEVNSEAAVNAEPGDLASPSGPVSPPPNAAQANP
jgi:hypothetical protein